MQINFNSSIINVFTEVTNVFWVSLDKKMKEIGLHGGQVFVLISLFEKDEQNQKELADNLRLTPPTVNNMVKSLRKNDFVNTSRSEEDGRVVFVSLTNKSTDLMPQIAAQFRQLEDEFFGALSDTEKLIVLQIFDKLKKNLFDDIES